MSRLLVSFWRAQTTALFLTVYGMLMMRRGQAGACRRSFGASLPLSAGPIVTTTSFLCSASAGRISSRMRADAFRVDRWRGRGANLVRVKVTATHIGILGGESNALASDF